MAANTVAVVGFTILSVLAFIVSTGISILTTIPNNGIFNNSMENLSLKYTTDITPEKYAFSIWGLIFLFQLAWIGYALSCMCRRNKDGMVLTNPSVLPVSFHICWIISSAAISLWNFYFFDEQMLFAALCLVVTTVFGFSALGINVCATASNERRIPRSDLICIRVLIQNGIDLYFSWCTFATLISISVALTYDPKVPRNYSQEDSGTFCLYALGIVIIAWSILENTKLYRYCRYVYAWYFVLLWALSGIIVRNHDVSKKNTIITITLLCLSVVALIAKITVYCLSAPTSYKRVKKYQLLEE
uniref:uncharacterized protein LOC120338816 n=1 Tax=Styela clava TaxID=7725 RepID=UPI00193A5770|nr:uncharacterized protein LOC120338816 [Styela clava]